MRLPIRIFLLSICGAAALLALPIIQKEKQRVLQPMLKNALVADRFDLVEPLLHSGVDPNFSITADIVSNNRKVDRMVTPLHVAVGSNEEQVVIQLINYGVDVDVMSDYSGTPLHIIAGNHTGINLASLLIVAGANIDQENHVGVTPLFTAVACNNVEMVAFLIHHGADVHQKGWDDKTMLSVAISMQWYRSAHLLRLAGAKE